jgi:hypothetical protein
MDGMAWLAAVSPDGKRRYTQARRFAVDGRRIQVLKIIQRV